MTALGAEIVAIDYGPFEKTAAMLYAGPWVAERLAAIGDLAERDPDAIHPAVRGIVLGARAKTAVETFQAFYDLAEHIAAARREWAKIDVLLLPTAGTTFKIAEMLADPITLNTRLGAYTNFVNLMDLAALAVPAGFRPDGIPFGVTLIGPALSDGMLASIGDALHRSLADARLGATKVALSSTPPVAPGARADETVSIAVVGAHLTGQPLNGQLVERKATLRGGDADRARLLALCSCRHVAAEARAAVRRRPATAASRSKSGTWTLRPSAPSSP